jgi:membrane-bound lytic murein transglycosylase A
MEEVLVHTWTDRISLFLPLAFIATSLGCQPKKPPTPVPTAIDFTQELPAGTLALRKVSPGQYPDFSQALRTLNLADLRKSTDNSLAYLHRRSSEKKYPYLDIGHDRAVASVRAFRELIDSGVFALPPDQFNRTIAERFEVYQSIGAPSPDGSGYTNKVLFTGYFTPTYDASLTHGGPYQWPLYKHPADLRGDESGDNVNRLTPEGTLVPYYTRREIESGALAGQELVWLTSRWNAYVVTVQGSARLRLPDGRIMEVGNAGTNGREYAKVGEKPVADGLIAKKDLNFDTMRAYFAAHPEAMDKYLWTNERTAFFADRPGGPFGALNVPVTKFASLATDKAVYPPAMVAFLSVPIPAGEAVFPLAGAAPGDSGARPFSGFALDQDRGGAIRSAGRCDIYMGIGERAQQVSGHQLNAGELYYLAVKPELVGKYASR